MVRNSKISDSSAERRLKDVVGKRIENCWRGHGSALFLEIGDLQALDGERERKGQLTLMVEWSWRVEASDSIVAGSWAGDEMMNLVPSMLIGQTVERAKFFGRLPEVYLSLSGGFWFATFATSCGDPQWSLRGTDEDWMHFENGRFHIQRAR